MYIYISPYIYIYLNIYIYYAASFHATLTRVSTSVRSFARLESLFQERV